MTALQVGVDVGGTFTDTIAIDPSRNPVKFSKVPSTPRNQSEGFLSGLGATGVPFDEISWLVHGTTVGTNATLERTGAVCGMVTTRGFRDVIELGRRERPHLFGLYGEFQPLITRDNRLEVAERIDARGNVVEALDEEALSECLKTLKNNGCEALLIAFLHAYANPVHEYRAREIARKIWPNDYITISVEVLREYREFERFGTAALNAYIQPPIHRYITRLKDGLKGAGVKRDLAIMQTNGGIMSADAACQYSVNTVLSGPAAGVIAAAYISRAAGFNNIMTCDMGGTSFDVGMIVSGEPVIANDRDLAFGLPMRIPVIDVHTIGAGGGSIADVNAGNILNVGPRSAGAVPGPIAFGRGGDRPTVTDANVLLGRLSAEKLLAVSGSLDLDKIRRIFKKQLGEPLGIDAEQAAAVTLKVTNDAMAGAIRLVSLQRGYDPRDFSIFAFGGAGPLHGAALARELGVPRMIVPYIPGITCALGCIVADVRHDVVQTIVRPLDMLGENDIANILQDQRKQANERLESEHISFDGIEITHSADMQYEGQTYTLRIPINLEDISIDSLGTQLANAFQSRFGIDLSSFRAQLINIRTTITGTRPPVDLKSICLSTEKRATVVDAKIGERKVWFDDAWVDTPIYDRAALPVGAEIEGPAIFNQLDTTTVTEPGNKITVDAIGNLIVKVGQ